MKLCLITSCWVGLAPCFAMADIPTPYRSDALLLEAENIILCSDFDEINGTRIAQFLDGLGQHSVSVSVLDGPETVPKSISFNALVVVSGVETKSATFKCAISTAPYRSGLSQEIFGTVQNLEQPFEHPNPTINAALGEIEWHSSNFYHEEQNWVTKVIAVREPSANLLNSIMIGMFDLPYDTCEQNPACLTR